MSHPTSGPSRPLSSLELMPPEEADALGQRLLDEQLAYVGTRSAFYRARWDASTPPGSGDLTDLPLTTKDDLRVAQEQDAPFGSLRAASRESIVRLHVTSGTTGRALAVAFTAGDLRGSTSVGSRTYWAAGLRPDDIVLHCLNYSFYVGGVADHLSIEATGATVVPVGIGQSDRLIGMWASLRPTAMFCTPSYGFHLAERVEAAGIDPRDLGLRLIVTGGEPGGDDPSVRQRLTTQWGCEISDAYGLGEVWPSFAGQCDVRDGLHLTAPEYLWCELIEPATGSTAPLTAGATGEIVYTHLRREAMPLVRYRSGDLVEVLSLDCPCGRRTPRLRLRGRVDQMFQAKGVNVFPSAVHEVLTAVVPGLGDFAMVVDGPAPSGPVPLYVECPRPDEPGLAEEVTRAVRVRLQFNPSVHLTNINALGLSDEHKTRRVFRTHLGERIPGLTEEEP